MTPEQNAASTDPIHAVDYTDTERRIAMAIDRAAMGAGPGDPLWLIVKADKTTNEVTCAIRSTLPNEFLPR